MVVGAGIIGLATAWWLQRRGHRVQLLDPEPLPASLGMARSGSGAALGVLMGDLFHRASGRAWRLRQQALELWPAWRQELAAAGWPIPYRAGLLQLAADEAEAERLRCLAQARQSLGLPVQFWPRERLAELAPALPLQAAGGLHSRRDGQLDPIAAMAAFGADGLRRGLELICDRATGLQPHQQNWRIALQGGGQLEADRVVLANGCGITALLAPRGHRLTIEPVLGQAAELELESQTPSSEHWPAAVLWRGINLVPRPNHRLWIGATLEPGVRADAAALAELLKLGGQAPPWLLQAHLLQSWHGIRPRPLQQPAPLLCEPEPGLLVSGGSFRNGVLLAPAMAQWCAERIETGGGSGDAGPA